MNVHNIVGFFSQTTRERIATHIENDHLAAVTEPHHVVTFGPVGAENRVAFAYRRVVDGQVEARIVAGCWHGNLAEFRERVLAVYGTKGESPDATHHEMYWMWASCVYARLNQWRDEYEPPKPKAHILELWPDWHGFLDSAKSDKNPTGAVIRFLSVGGHDPKAEAEAWLARQLADEPTDDEPKRCSHISGSGHRCRMNEGHATDTWDHYRMSDTLGYCDYDDCVKNHSHLGRHLLADGTEVPA